MTKITIPILNLETEAPAHELIDAIRIATNDQFLIKLQGQIFRNDVLDYDFTATAPSARDSDDQYADHDAEVLAVVFNLVHRSQGASRKTLTLTMEEAPHVRQH